MIKGIFLDLSCCCAVLSHFNCVRLFAAPWTVAARQGCGSGLPCPLPGDLPDPGIELLPLALCTGRLGSLPGMWKTTKRAQCLQTNALLTEKGGGMWLIHSPLSTLSDNEWVHWKGRWKHRGKGQWVWLHRKAGVTLGKSSVHLVCSEHGICMDTKKDDVGAGCWGRRRQRCAY